MPEKKGRVSIDYDTELSFEDAVTLYAQVQSGFNRIQTKYTSFPHKFRRNLGEDDLGVIMQSFGILLPLSMNEAVQVQFHDVEVQAGEKEPLLFKIMSLQSDIMLFASKYRNSGVVVFQGREADELMGISRGSEEDKIGEQVGKAVNEMITVENISEVSPTIRTGMVLARSAFVNFVGQTYLNFYAKSEGYGAIKFNVAGEDVVVGNEKGRFNRSLSWDKEVKWANQKSMPGLKSKGDEIRAGIVLRANTVLDFFDRSIK